MKFEKGHIPWNKGIKAKDDIRIARFVEAGHNATRGGGSWNKGLKGYNAGINHWTYGKKRLEIRSEKHWNWKGNNVGMVSLHNWVKRRLGKPNKCEFCGTTKNKRYEWANKSHLYKRDLTDWIRLCHSCHRIYDKAAYKQWETMRRRYADNILYHS